MVELSIINRKSLYYSALTLSAIYWLSASATLFLIITTGPQLYLKINPQSAVEFLTILLEGLSLLYIVLIVLLLFQANRTNSNQSNIISDLLNATMSKRKTFEILYGVLLVLLGLFWNTHFPLVILLLGVTSIEYAVVDNMYNILIEDTRSTKHN